MDERNNMNQYSLKPQIRKLIIKNIEKKFPSENLVNNYRLFFYDVMLKLIMYFQPFDIKFPAINQPNSEIKAYCIVLPKWIADSFINNIEYNQIGEVVNNQIRKRLFVQFQILKEIRECIDEF